MSCPALRQIHVYDRRLRYADCAVCRRPYGSICFDGSCFWALSHESPGRLYRLDPCLRETDCLSLRLPDCRGFPAGVGVFDERCLLVCGAFGAAAVSKADGELVSLVGMASEKQRFCAAASLPCGFVGACNCGGTHSLVWRDAGGGEDLRCWLPERVRIEDVAWCAADGGFWLYVLVTKQCRYSRLLSCLLCSVREGGSGDGGSCHCAAECGGRGGGSCRCAPDCGGGGCRCAPDCGDGGCCNRAEEIISSVASVETALSHILNAEGEKIQAVLRRCGDTDRIRQVNADVCRTVTAITQLEQVLYAKMQIALELCSGGCASQASGGNCGGGDCGGSAAECQGAE